MEQIIIIGAGILGASTAYHLAKNGVNVTIIDRAEEGQATKVAAGIICPWISQRRNKAWYELAKKGAAYYEPLIQQLEQVGEKNTGYERVGALSLQTEEKIQKVFKRAEERKVDAPEMREIYCLTSEQTEDYFPLLQNEFQSVFISGAARVDGHALSEALLRVATSLGANKIVGDASLVTSNEKVIGVQVNGQLYEPDKIIVTAGAWAKELLTPLGLDVQISGQKAQIAHFHVPNINTSNWPVVMPPTNQYLLAFEEGKIVAGATYEDKHEFDVKPTVGGLYEILSKALPIAPKLAEAQFTEIRVGYRPFTPTFLPIIGQLPTHPNMYIANGLGSSGLTVGPFLGQQLAKLVLGEQVDIRLENYNVDVAIR